MHTTNGSRRRVLLAPILAVVLAAGFAATPASGATEAQQGGQLLQRLQAGTTTCKSLSTTDFDHVGEYVMERMLGSAGVHEAMNRQMVAMMGARGETQAHVYMGQRFAGCARGNAPTAFGSMMGMMGAGMMGSVYGRGNTSTVMGSGSDAMMGFGNNTAPANGDGWSGGDTTMVVLMVLLLALVAGALFAWRPWRRADQTPLETLQNRFARGEIDQHDYDARREALGGTA